MNILKGIKINILNRQAVSSYNGLGLKSFTLEMVKINTEKIINSQKHLNFIKEPAYQIIFEVFLHN